MYKFLCIFLQKKYVNTPVTNQQTVKPQINKTLNEINGKHSNDNSFRRFSSDFDFEGSDEADSIGFNFSDSECDSIDNDYYEPQAKPYQISDNVLHLPESKQSKL